MGWILSKIVKKIREVGQLITFSNAKSKLLVNLFSSVLSNVGIFRNPQLFSSRFTSGWKESTRVELPPAQKMNLPWLVLSKLHLVNSNVHTRALHNTAFGPTKMQCCAKSALFKFQYFPALIQGFSAEQVILSALIQDFGA